MCEKNHNKPTTDTICAYSDDMSTGFEGNYKLSDEPDGNGFYYYYAVGDGNSTSVIRFDPLLTSDLGDWGQWGFAPFVDADIVIREGGYTSYDAAPIQSNGVWRYAGKDSHVVADIGTDSGSCQ